MSMGEPQSSQVSTTGMAAACRRWRVAALWAVPVSTMPSGRRAIRASSMRSSWASVPA
jgi:hypothetical protein